MPDLPKERAQAWSTALPQEQPFWEDFDADYIFDFADRLSAIGMYELGFRPGGSEAAHRAADLIEDEMRSLGLQGVHKDPFPVYAWGFAGARLELADWDPIAASSYPPTPGTPPEGLSTLLVDAGHGTAQDYQGVDVQDRVAFVRLDLNLLPWVGVLAHEAELHGACAVVFYYLNSYAQHESGQALNTHDGVARSTIPLLQIAKGDGVRVAERLAAEGPLQVTLHSKVDADPQGTGLNVIGQIPGRLKDQHLIVGAHYDAWFHGYWDNAVGVAGMLAMAKTLLESDYQPKHTILFAATDAEEFGAPDTHFDWLIGCYHMLKGHPEWSGRVSGAFNIDTLAFLEQEQLGFIAPPELLAFLRAATEDHKMETFAQPDIWVKEQVTAWTEVLTHAYFGIPPLQPRFALSEARETVYHTQFDDRSIVHRERAAETIQLYGALLVRFDRQEIVPYDFTERVGSLRATLQNPPPGEAKDELKRLNQALDLLQERAERLNRSLAQSDGLESEEQRQRVNAELRKVAGHLIQSTNYLSPQNPDDALALHVYYERDLRALDAALAHLAGAEPQQAIEALIDGDTGLHGAWYAQNLSYPVYYRQTVGGGNPGRCDLFWGQNRTATVTDIWIELHSLRDKAARGVADFGAEIHTLKEKRRAVAEAYREAVAQLAEAVEEAGQMLALDQLSGREV